MTQLSEQDSTGCERQIPVSSTESNPETPTPGCSWIFLYGPSGSGKSAIGARLANDLHLPLYDTDEIVSLQAGKSIPEIFAVDGEDNFRRLESAILEEVICREPGVVALGGGTLLNATNRSRVEALGDVICLFASSNVLMERLASEKDLRPLLSGDMQARLLELLQQRAAHYASFDKRVDTGDLSPEDAAWEVQVRSGRFRITGMGGGYDVRVCPDGITRLGATLKSQSLGGPVAVVTDQNIAGLYLQSAVESIQKAGFAVQSVILPAGEAYKTVATVLCLWEEFLEIGLERSSTIVALGGGVVSDLVGFGASAYLRGVPWVVVPTSLLGMVDASIGGKTGVDMPRGKNLVGAFYPPKFVLADPNTLPTLPEIELRNGMAEVVKHGLIGDPILFSICVQGWGALEDRWGDVVRRAMAVKICVIQKDPYEHDQRASLNLGHTIGHALETASEYQLRHGEAVAIGMVTAARLSEWIGVAETGIAEEVVSALEGLGLPTKIPPGLDRKRILAAMRFDKKRLVGRPRFVLPVRVGEVRWGIDIEDWESKILEG